MIFKFIATAAIALGLAGFMLALSKLSRGLIPKWTILVAAVIGIMGFQIFDEYNWASRKQAGLQEASGEFVVVGQYQEQVFWRPWTYVKAPITRIDAVNIARNQPVEGAPGLFQNFIGISRFSGQVTQAPFIFDCPNASFTPAVDDLENALWAPMPALMKQGVCN